MLSERHGYVYLDINPFYHLIEVIRAPLLGSAPTTISWLVSIGMALIGWIITLYVYGKYKNRISYWL